MNLITPALTLLTVAFLLTSQAHASIPNKALRVGDKAPNFTLPNAHSETVELNSLLKNGSVVLTFYRGGWCPICNTQLHSYQKSLTSIKGHNAQLVAISPETPTNAERTMVKNELTFEVLSDNENQVAEQFAILWEVPEDSREGFSNWLTGSSGQTLEEYNDAKGYTLPKPATYVINQDGIITYAFVPDSYKDRAPVDDILNALNLK